MKSVAALLALIVVLPVFVARPRAQADAIEYRIVATTKTSTMEKELNEAGDAGFRMKSVMGGETAFGGKETVAVVARTAGAKGRYQYKLLATNRTSTMQKEIQEAAEAGYDYRGQTVFDTLFGGQEVVVVMERDSEHPIKGDTYKLLATSKTSTMEKELNEVGSGGYEVLGMTVSKTLMGGKELVAITRRRGGK